MISQEPTITVGIVERIPEVRGSFQGRFAVTNVIGMKGDFTVRSERGTVIFTNAEGQRILSGDEILCQPLEQGTFTLNDVKIGIGFHWERDEDETFEGRLRLVAQDNRTVTAVNEIGLESYLKSVISSEMSAEAPVEFLRAHAIVSRSWLASLLERKKGRESGRVHAGSTVQNNDEFIRWYGEANHESFDVCADDHCQRYQGISKIINNTAIQAVESTRGMFLVHDQEICDARYSKACGGLTEDFENVWQEVEIPYLRSISDSPVKHKPIRSERDAERWIESRPEAYCNAPDENILRSVLSPVDQPTKDFFRWSVEYTREELEEIVRTKSGMDFGTLMDLIPVLRGSSGRIIKLKIVGTAKSMTIGKELEIRKCLSRSHLCSSAFTVTVERSPEGIASMFVLKGAGWGHGVGLCQIGAAVMASKGIKADDILFHYFEGAGIAKLY